MNNTYNPLLCLLSDRGELPPEKLALLEARERDSLKIKTIFDGTLTPNEIIYLDEEIDKYLIKSKDSNIQNGNPLEIRELIDNSNGKSGLALF